MGFPGKGAVLQDKVTNRGLGSYGTAAKSLQLCLTLCDPIDGSLPGSPVPGILQARTREWVAISFYCTLNYTKADPLVENACI